MYALQLHEEELSTIKWHISSISPEVSWYLSLVCLWNQWRRHLQESDAKLTLNNNEAADLLVW